MSGSHRSTNDTPQNSDSAQKPSPDSQPEPKSSEHFSVCVSRLLNEKAATSERWGWHGFRRAWATRRKVLPVQEVMRAGGWRDVKALQSADPETVRRVLDMARRDTFETQSERKSCTHKVFRVTSNVEAHVHDVAV